MERVGGKKQRRRQTQKNSTLRTPMHEMMLQSCVRACELCRTRFCQFLTALPCTDEILMTRNCKFHPKTLFEIAMALLTISVSFPSKSRFSVTFSILLRFGGFWNLGLSQIGVPKKKRSWSPEKKRSNFFCVSKC